MPSPLVRADVLARLLLIQETTEVLLDGEAIAAFLGRALSDMPGLVAVHLAMDGRVFPPSPEVEAACARADAASPAGRTFVDGTAGVHGAMLFPLRTMRRGYGQLVLLLDDRGALLPYAAFLQNIANVIASQVETRGLIGELEAERAHLESEVVERTARLRASEASLQESQSRLAAAMEQAQLAHWEMDGATSTFTFNDRFYALYGTTADREGGYRMSAAAYAREFLLPEDEHLVRESIAALLDEGADTLQVEHRIRRRDGVIRGILVRIEVVRDAAGQVVGTRGVNQDITDRAEAEARLIDSESRFRQAMHASPVPMAMNDELMNITFVNPAFVRTFGYAPDELRTLADWWPAAYPDPAYRLSVAVAWQERLEAMLRTGEPFTPLEVSVRCRDGAQKTVMASAASLSGASSGTHLVVLYDITDRTLAESALRTSERRLQDVIESSGEWVWEVNADAVYTFSSRRGEELFGDVLGKTPFDFMRPEEAARVRAQFSEVSASRRPFQDLENWNVGRDGRMVCLLSNGVPILDDAGQLLGYRGVDRDVTALKQQEAERAALQAQLQRSQRMEAVGRLAGGVAHDFNNMLGVIIGNIDFALELLAAGEPVADELREVRDAALRSAELTRQLLAFASRQTVVPKVLDLNETVTSMLKMLQRLIGEAIELTWRPHGGLWPVRVDPSQVDQVLANLCVNGRDAIAGVGSLRIETGHLTLSRGDCAGRTDCAPGDYVVLSVTDDGSGIDRETLAHVFEPFYTTKSAGKGTGLGLATVWGIVQQNRGFVDVVSELGVGTTVRVCLPRHVGDGGGASAQADEKTTRGGGETILLVEDEPGLLTMASRMLERLGYRVFPAATVAEALRVATEHDGEIDLLVTDVVMPAMNGRDLADRVRQVRPRVKRLFVSGYAADVLAGPAMQDERLHFLQKPFTQHTLARGVRAALEAE